MKGSYAIVDMKHRGTEDLVASLPVGEPLLLIREPMNLYDRNAIHVWARTQHVGFIPTKQNKDLARKMDAAGLRQIPARLTTSGDRWPLIEVDE